jgi:MSHA biogenesis protein MshQ
LVVASSLVIPAAGRNGSADDGAIANGASFTATTPAGTFSSNTLSWDEYGIIKLQPSIADDDYLGTGAITGTESGNVGRFYAAGFTLTSGTVVAACNGFTYMDQNALTVNYDLEARNTLGNVLYNYDTGLLGSSGVATPVYHAENNNQGSDVIARLPISGTTAILPWRQAPSSLPVTAALMDHTRCCSWACRSVMDLTGLPSRVRI